MSKPVIGCAWCKRLNTGEVGPFVENGREAHDPDEITHGVCPD